MTLTRRTFTTLGAVALAAGFALTFVPGESSAQPSGAPSSANVEVMVLHASNDAPQGIDPKIDEGFAAGQGPSGSLQKPPLSAYKTYKLLDRKTVAVNKGQAGASLPLPNGRNVKVALNDVVQEKTDKGVSTRYKVNTVVLDGATQVATTDVTTPAGKTFFLGGQPYKGGSLVLAFTVK